MKSINLPPTINVILLVMLVLCITIADSLAASVSKEVKEIMPGMLEGYLTMEE